MTSKKAEKWLEERGITLQENFVTALKKLAKDFQKEHGIKNIGLKKQYLVYWSKNPHSVQTKKLQVKNNLYCCRSI